MRRPMLQSAAFGAILLCLPQVSRAAALPNSAAVTTEPGDPPVSPSNVDSWGIWVGSATIGASGSNAPDGSPVIEYSASVAGSIVAQNTLQHPLDVRHYDSFTFWAQASATRIGDFVYLLDSSGRRRWYSLILSSARGWQRPTYWLDAFVGQENGFDPTVIARIRFGQAGQKVGDKLRFSAVTFEHSAVSHGDAASPWYPDIGAASFAVVPDGAAGTPTSVRATVKANAQGQADVAINLIAPRIVWDWSGKSFLSFYFKDTETSANHYFLVYDKDLHYREWVFSNPRPGEWIRVTANLAAPYVQSGLVDLSRIVYFEVGVFGGSPGATYTFQVDEIAVY